MKVTFKKIKTRFEFESTAESELDTRGNTCNKQKLKTQILT